MARAGMRAAFRLAPLRAGALLFCSALACGEAGAPPEVPGTDGTAFALSIVAKTELEPLGGVRVFAGEALLGTTGDAGTLPLELSGTEGERVPLRIECPSSYQSPPQPLVVGLWRPSEGAAAPTFEVECAPSVHCLVAGIAAQNGAHLPVSYLGQRVGHTDALGLAHVLVCAPSHEQVSLTLDTTARPELRPQNPALTFVAGERAELVLLQLELVEPPRARVARAKRTIPIEIKH